MRGWIRSSLLMGACALTWACGGGGGPIFSNPNTNVVGATSATAIVGRGTVDTTNTNQITSSESLGRSDVGVIDSESTTDTNENAVGTLAAAADPSGLPTPTASELGWISAPPPEGSVSADQNGITIINIGADKHIHVFGDGHGHPLIIIVAGTDTVTVAATIVRQQSPISLSAESAASNRVRGSLSS